MKRGTVRHPKTSTLAAILNVPLWGAVGILESLWHFAQEFALPGDVGRFPDEAIANAIGWTENAATLTSGLVQAGWLDRCLCHRVRIHDWPHHADQTVKRVLSTRNQEFLGCYDDASTALGSSELPLPLPLPKAVAKPSLDLDEFARRYLSVCGAVFGAKYRVVSPEVRDKLRDRLKDWQPWQIIAGPILIYAQGRRDRHTPDVFLRDGKHARTRDGQTYGAYNWLAKAYDSIDGTKLDARLADIASQAGVLDDLLKLGVEVSAAA